MADVLFIPTFALILEIIWREKKATLLHCLTNTKSQRNSCFQKLHFLVRRKIPLDFQIEAPMCVIIINSMEGL